MRRLRTLVLYVAGAENATLSYQFGWPAALAEDQRFDCMPVNLRDMRARAALLTRLRLRRRPVFDVVVLFHSVFSNACALRGALFRAVAVLEAPKVFFVGNEYKLMPEKVAFAEQLGIDLLVSQLSSADAHDLYRRRLGCAVIGLPNSGLDPAVYAPRTPWAQRPVDVGYRAYDAPLYLGHAERRLLAERGRSAAANLGLVSDISLDPADRLEGSRWAAFLDTCKAVLGSEAGADFFELTDATRLAVNAFLEENPHAGLDEVRARFFSSPDARVSGRAISSRVIEAAGTKTVQVLVEGHYGGYLRAHEHYVPLKADGSNIEAALVVLRDEAECRRMVDAAYEVAMLELTFPPLLDRFYDALQPLL